MIAPQQAIDGPASLYAWLVRTPKPDCKPLFLKAITFIPSPYAVFAQIGRPRRPRPMLPLRQSVSKPLEPFGSPLLWSRPGMNECLDDATLHEGVRATGGRVTG